MDGFASCLEVIGRSDIYGILNSWSYHWIGRYVNGDINTLGIKRQEVVRKLFNAFYRR